MITKPEDAIPESLYNGKTPILYFTAKECAEIAMAYAEAKLMLDGTGKKEYAQKCETWEARFKEWETL